MITKTNKLALIMCYLKYITGYIKSSPRTIITARFVKYKMGRHLGLAVMAVADEITASEKNSSNKNSYNITIIMRFHQLHQTEDVKL